MAESGETALKRYLTLILFAVMIYQGNAAVYESIGHTPAMYDKDIAILKKRLALHGNDRTALERIVKILFVCEQFEDAARYADDCLKLGRDSDIEYLKALSLASCGRYRDAVSAARNILTDTSLSSGDRKAIEAKITVIEQGIPTGGFPSGAKMTEWGKDAYAAGIIGRDGILVGVRALSGQPFLYSIANGDVRIPGMHEEYAFPGNVKLLAISVSPDGREMFATCEKNDKSVSILCRRFDIETEKWTEWSDARFSNAGTINGFANMLGDGEHLLFVSNRNKPNGLDIYVVRRNEKGAWENPEPVGNVNTSMDECSLFVHPDGETVFFSTNGRGGCGGYDVFSGSLSSLRNVFSINNIVNQKQFNTFRNESFPLYVHGVTGKAFLSFRRNSSSVICSAIGDVNGTVPVLFLDVVTLDSVTKKPVRAMVRLARIGDRTSGITLRAAADIHGRAPFTVRKKTRYAAEVNAEGYAYYTESFETPLDADSLTRTIYLDKGKVKAGYTFTADNIYFDSGSARLRTESIPALERLFDFMKNNPGVKIEIAGHTDNVGGYRYNLDLSMRRAESVAEYLFGRGIQKNRISSKGYGYSNSVTSNSNEEDRQKNRRVEITVKSSD